MSTPNPVPETPLPSEWNSAVIRNIAYAFLTLVATVAADYFGVTAELVMTKGGRLIEAVLSVVVVALPLYLAYRARKYRATPPITPEAAQAAVIREKQIAAAPTEEQRERAAA
jgi:hypothetical protein